jgi:histone-lysine N-methyltransferase SETMAR
VTLEAIAAVKVIVKENCRVTVNEVAAHMDMNHRSTHRIVHDVLQFHKVSARWVPRQLTAKLKKRRVDAWQEILKRFEAEGDGFLGRIVTGDETRVQYHQPETKKASEEWHHTSSPKPNKFRTQSSAGKVMLTLFWDKRGVILEDYMPRGDPVTSTTYADLLKNNLLPAVKSKLRGLLNTGVLLQCDNARSHTASSTAATIQDCHLSVFHVSRTRRTSHPATFMFLDHSKRRWDASLSGSTKRCSRRCTSGCILSQKNFFLQVFVHFRRAGTLVWNSVETT